MKFTPEGNMLLVATVEGKIGIFVETSGWANKGTINPNSTTIKFDFSQDGLFIRCCCIDLKNNPDDVKSTYSLKVTHILFLC
jgi:hypothetical protein